MNPLDPAVLALGIVVTAILFVAVAYFTRAGWRRILGGILAAVPVAPLVMLYDKIAAHMGWWRYPSVTGGTAPLAWYIASALGYGAAFGLIGWRIIRRWGGPGCLVFLALFALFGLSRDYAYSLTTRLIVFGPGLLPFLADFAAYGSAAALVQLLMRLFAGPARSDALRR